MGLMYTRQEQNTTNIKNMSDLIVKLLILCKNATIWYGFCSLLKADNEF